MTVIISETIDSRKLTIREVSLAWCEVARKRGCDTLSPLAAEALNIKLRRMTVPTEALASPVAAVAPPEGLALTPPVTYGPVAVSSLGGIPLIGITGPIHHFSGRKLRAMIMKALTDAGLTVDLPE